MGPYVKLGNRLSHNTFDSGSLWQTCPGLIESGKILSKGEMVSKGLERATPRQLEAMDATMVQLEAMKAAVGQNQRGQFFIDDINMINMGSDKLRLLNWLLGRLVVDFPTYVWQQSEAIDPNIRGVMISWYPKHGR